MNGFWILAVIGKWIGIVLLAVLLLLLLLVFLVLFSPINYQVEGEKRMRRAVCFVCHGFWEQSAAGAVMTRIMD